MSSGHPIKEVTSKNPSGFGLGVGQIYFPDGGGPTWFYEGTTMGYRTYYLFTPCNDIVLSLAMNSSPLLVSKDISDNISLLAKKVYEQILVEQPEYNCKMKNSNKKM
jgi:D-alanyl-D-alanine carboxypeptidase